MVVKAALNNLASSAVSFTMAGNTGILPFLSLLVIGIVERQDPTILNMERWIEQLLASWWGISFFGLMTILEFISMCIPVVDEVVDSIMTFIIPLMSILASMSTFGIYTLPGGAIAAPTPAANVTGARALFDTTTSSSSTADMMTMTMTMTMMDDETAGHRELNNIVHHLTTGFKIFVVAMGILLALSLHVFKMLIRLIGEGWLTYCLTIIETTWCVTTILIALFIRPIAIAIAVAMIVAAVYGIIHTLYKRNQRSRERLYPGTTTTASYGTTEGP
eukprot:CAMPEP_0116562002 /NCGR_PEP_ID=MMETSP0397-20121206/11908_1 /TAXON_ID=216820 /ORGANISM="Cyclophora tenuis, Strain ECT3854" /LENGTH=275 /DNA_ID=CAMNT_0004088231 /DNA_START=188 /DNA_END=1015 /DNA_ORIENTATION=+